jgi:hypothetical protein
MTLTTHRTIEFAMGLVVALVGIVLGSADAIDASAAAIVVAGILGIALITMGIAATREGAALPPANHAALDRILITALLVAGVIMLAAGDAVIGAVCILGGAVQLALALMTDYAYARDDVSGGTTTTT